MGTETVTGYLPDCCHKMLVAVNLWPKSLTETGKVKRTVYLKAALFHFIVGIPIYFTFYHMIFGRKTTSDVLLFEISITIFYICVILIGGIYLYNLQKIVDMAFSWSTYFVDSEEKIMLQSIQNTKFAVSQKILYLGAVAYVVMRLLSEPFCRRHLKEDTTDYCGLILPMEVPEKYNYFPVRQIISIMQCSSVVIHFQGMLALFVLCICALEQINLNINLLKRSLTTLKPNMPYSFYRNYFRHFAITHYNIIRFTNILNDISNYIHFAHITCTSIEFALLSIDIYFHRNVASIIHFMGWIFALSYLSKLCQDVHDESEDLSFEVYNIKWYDMDTRVRHYVQFILMASQKPIVIHAGPFANVCIQTMMKLFKVASSYMTMLINLQS